MNRLVTNLGPRSGHDQLSIDEIEPPVPPPQSGEAMRARTQEVSASSKKLTRVDGELGGCRSFDKELKGWFSGCPIDLTTIVRENSRIDDGNDQQRLAFVLGDISKPRNFTELQRQIIKNSQDLFNRKGDNEVIGYATSDDIVPLTLAFIMLLAASEPISLKFVSALVKKISQKRWRDISHVSSYVQILRISLWKALGDPGHVQEMPDVPFALAEKNVLRRKILKKQALMQFETESSLFNGIGFSSEESFVQPDSKAHALYISVLPYMKSFVRVVADYLADNVSISDQGVRAAVVSLTWLLSWFTSAHVLSGEYLAALLFDSHIPIIAHEFFSRHGNVLEELMQPSSDNVWLTLWKLAGKPRNYELPSQESPKIFSDPIKGLSLEYFDHFRLETYIALAMLQKECVLSSTQRIILASELSTEPLKSLLGTYNKQLWSLALSFVRAESPYTGKRWRYLNMELISAVYLHCPPSPYDNFLNEEELNEEMRDAEAQEGKLRLLLEFYNQRCLRSEAEP